MEKWIKIASCMKHIYLITYNGLALQYGVGTYIQQMIKCIKGNNMLLTLINFSNNVTTFKISQDHELRTIELPLLYSLHGENRHIRYMKYAFYFLTYYISNNETNIFHFNFVLHKKLANLLKAKYSDSHIILTVHYLSWLKDLNGNISKLQSILERSEEYNSLLEQDISNKYYESTDFLNCADKIICLSKYTQFMLSNSLKINPEKIEVVYNGLEEKQSHPTYKDIIELRNKYYFSTSEKIILFVGRLDKAKGIEYLIEAFRIVLQSIPDSRLVIVGDGNYNLYFHNSEDIWSKITLTGKISKEKLYKLYQLADIGTIPSLCEQCCYTAIEMMMFGLPFIGTSSTGLKEMLDNHPNDIVMLKEEEEFFFPVDELAKKIITRLLQKKSKDKSMYHDRYSLKQMKNKILQLYYNL